MSPSGLHLAMLRTAALLVGEQQRAEWLAEWTSELWHAGHEPHGANLTAFCLGAFRDAFWLRSNAPLPRSYGVLHLDVPSEPVASQSLPEFGVPFLQSPARCLSLLSVMAMVSVSAAFLLPTARNLILPSPYPDARNLVLVTSNAMGSADRANGLLDPYASVSVDEFRFLRKHADMAFYLATHVQIGHTNLFVARTSPDLFRLLSIRIPAAGEHRTSFVLTQAAWRRYFKSEPGIVGSTVNVAGKPAVVTGILAASQWTLPAKVDGWLLEDDAAFAALPADAEGFAVGRLPRPVAGFSSLSLAARHGAEPFISLVLEFLFGCLLVRVRTPFSLGHYPQNMRPGRWLFLTAKLALVLPIVIFGALDLGSLGSSISDIALLIAALGGMFAMGWALADQRRRCPVCLRILANPVRIGQSSRMLLEWHGTELVCLRGHGLLHIPERPAIWFTTQQWMDLDSSWSGLFSDRATSHSLVR